MLAVALSLVSSPQAATAAAGLPEGRYNCYLFFGKPARATFTGALFIAGSAYRVKDQPVRGEYDLDQGSGRVRWKGKPPLGFQVGVLETDGKIRMYISEADIGNKWKAALCSLAEGEAPTAGTSTTGGDTPAAFKPGDRVETEYAGLWYPGVVLKVERGGYAVHYDDPKWNDVWVEAKRVRARR